MSDDLTQKISQISQMLNQDGMQDNLKGLLSMFANSMGSSSSDSKESEPSQTAKTSTRESQNTEKSLPPSGNNSNDDLVQNLEMLRTVQRVMDVMRPNKNDPRVNLLTAVRPYLNTSRQQKLANCIKLLQFTSISKLMGDEGKSLFK